MGDVTSFLVDGMSGLAPGDVDGQCIVAGCCSRGLPGKAYCLGKRMDVEAVLGVGPLVDALRDLFAAAGQDPVVIAVPVEGQPGGYVTDVVYYGSGPAAKSSGLAAFAADVLLEVVVGGENGVAEVKISTDGGQTFAHAVTVPEHGEVVIECTGARISFMATPENPLLPGDQYSFKVVTPLSQRRQSGGGPAIAAQGEPKAGGQLRLAIIKSGELNAATYQLSIDGGDNYAPARTMPIDAAIDVPQLGIGLILAPGEYQAGTIYSWEVLPPVATTVAMMEAVAKALESHDVEFVHIVGPSDSVDWAAASALAEELWNRHRPTYFKFEARLPHAGEDLNDWATWLINERKDFASKYVQVVAAFGETADSGGLSRVRSWGGLNAGRVVSIGVQHAAGNVEDGPVSQALLPDGWNESLQKTLENEGYITAKRYAGMHGVYWGDSRTMAEITSDFRYEEVVRVAFKAIRLARVAALKMLYSEAGDTILKNSAAGLERLRANMASALGRMTAAVPPEMADFAIDIPPDQDIVNNGLAVELTFIGIAIFREIKLYGRYVYAGGQFDPRLSDASYVLAN